MASELQIVGIDEMVARSMFAVDFTPPPPQPWYRKALW